VLYEHLCDVAHADDPRRAELGAAALATARQMRGRGELHPARQALR
jgi:hypothetical protein